MRNHNARRRYRLQAVAAVLGTLLFGAGLAAAPAQAVPKDAIQYVALGDSYASGQGAHPYEKSGAACFLSKKGYPVLADRLRDIELTGNAACSGNSTTAVMASLPYVLSAQTELVTVTAGGIDLGTNAILAICAAAPQSPECGAAIASAGAKLQDGSLYTAVATMLGAIHQHAPAAEVYITGYPLLFDPSHPYADIVNPVVVALNATIAQAASATGTGYVDVTAAFSGHGIGSADPWINFKPADIFDPANFHPTREGYRYGYFDSLLAAGVFSY